MKYLSRSLMQLENDPYFNFHPRCERLSITHMLFVDDLLMFSRTDPISTAMLFQKFRLFSRASGFEANLDKSNVYICGTLATTQGKIMSTLNIPAGEFPFRYLGVPLSTKKLSYIRCKPLIDKVLAIAKSRTVRHLSYAGRLQLVKTILLSYRPSGDTAASKKALISWADMGLPRSTGGWNIKNMELCNKPAVCKLLWAITHKIDKLWVRLVDSYYVKGRSLVGFQCTSAMSWSLKKIIGFMDLIVSVGGWSAVLKHGKFSITLMYQQLLPTLDKLLKWGVVSSATCPVCHICVESVDHLLFKCYTSGVVWQQVLQFRRCPGGFVDELNWIRKSCKRSGNRHKLMIMFFAESVYSQWMNRNDMIYNQHYNTP
ncbi:uncharacterized protein [Spinacia oleracea]|uniref:Reverse transcriptase domain-containing protein n=1 Tax=Spinacia oleracea TaxID=3562 RepID=A0ABM3RHN6_SPIOL|nr:uncharacterized protein LOC130469712 [Spinacia oleracea]